MKKLAYLLIALGLNGCVATFDTPYDDVYVHPAPPVIQYHPYYNPYRYYYYTPYGNYYYYNTPRPQPRPIPHQYYGPRPGNPGGPHRPGRR